MNLLPTIAIPQQERTINASPLELVYKAKKQGAGGNVLTPVNLRAVRDLEDNLRRAPSYQRICHIDRSQYFNKQNNNIVSNAQTKLSKENNATKAGNLYVNNTFDMDSSQTAAFNQSYTTTSKPKLTENRVHDSNCSFPMSIIRLFDGTHGPFFNDPHFERISEILNAASNQSHMRSLISFTLDKNSVINKERVFSHHLRSVLFNGLPLRGYQHGEDRKGEQMNTLKINVVSAFGDILSEKYDSGVGDMHLYYMNMDLFFNAVESQVVWDLLLAGGSLVFIFCFVWFQTGSLWITGWAVFGIITNFFGANLIYRIVLDFR